HHKKCVPIPEAISCERCNDLGVEDECKYDPLISSSLISVADLDLPQTVPLFTSQVLDQLYTSFELPLSVYESKEWELEDPDLIPTLDDWLLVFNWFTRNGTRFPQAAGFDAEMVLKEYFMKPPSL
ncbi:hypothetical protein HDU99_001809, partial [Rhizoclosmatium hyalinum]